MPRISVIIVNYNGSEVISACLEALKRQSFDDFELIFVDNNSTDGSLSEIQLLLDEYSMASHSQIIAEKSNLGFAGGCLEGLRHSKGEYIALLNNDTEPDKNWLKNLVRAMDSDPEVGICASKLMTYGTNFIDSAGDGFSVTLRGFKRGEGKEGSLYSRREYIFGACAGAALYRRKMIDEIGFLDEDFFLIHEDSDLNLRAQLSGWKVLYVPEAVVHHKTRSTIGNMSDTAVYYTVRNSELVRIKNVPFTLFLRCFPGFLLGMVSEFLYFVVKHRHPLLYFRAKLDVIKMLPRMLRKRRANMSARKTSSKDLQRMMTPVFKREYMKNKLMKLIWG